MRVVGCLALVTLVLVSPARGSDPSPRDQFLQEYTPHAEALLKHYANVRTRSTGVDILPDGRKLVRQHEGKWNRENFLFKVIAHTLEEPGKPETAALKRFDLQPVQGGNRQYEFRLGSEKGQYVLLNVTIYDDRIKGGNYLSKEAVPFAAYPLGMSYLEMARDEGTRILAYQDCSWQDRPAKELRVEYQVLDPRSGKKVPIRCSYFFSPAAGWVCVGKRNAPADPSKDASYTEAVYIYDTGVESPPPLKRFETWKVPKGDPAARKKTGWIEFEEYAPAPPFADEDFRLTAYGFPEPVGVKWPRPTPPYVWVLIAAGVCGVFALVFTWLARRRKRAAKPAESTTGPALPKA